MVMRSRDSRGTAMFDGVWRVPFTVTPFLPSTCSSQFPDCTQSEARQLCAFRSRVRAVRGLLRSKLYFISAWVREIVWFSPALQHSGVSGRLCVGNKTLPARQNGKRVPSSTSIGVLLRRPSVIS